MYEVEKCLKDWVKAREQPDRRVAANWDWGPAAAEGRGARDRSKWRAHDSAYYGLRWRLETPRQRFCDTPDVLHNENESNSRRSHHTALGSPFKRYGCLGSRLTRFGCFLCLAGSVKINKEINDQATQMFNLVQRLV